MILLQIKSITGYKPRPDYTLEISEDGTVQFTGRYYVGVNGERNCTIEKSTLREIKILKELLQERTKKNYLKKNLKPSFQIHVGDEPAKIIHIDEQDVVSEDLIQQIIELVGADKWIYAQLDLYLVLSKPNMRSKEFAILRAMNPKMAVETYLQDQENRNYKSNTDFISVLVGYQEAVTLVNPIIYFSYRENKILNNKPALLLNQGPRIDKFTSTLKLYFYISFGKRYNDASASYFMVAAESSKHAGHIFKSEYPHFMPGDFQQVDPGLIYRANPLFTTHIPIAIR